jgi:hypothetical protein
MWFPRAQIGLDPLVTGPHVRRATGGEHPAEIENGDAGTEIHDKGHVVFDQQDGHALPAQGAQEVRHYGRLPLAHACDRLIEQ